tara:strand:- start:1712 stop:2323 length:612 start_codon:yes stop_codon:yes gene_type:complete
MAVILKFYNSSPNLRELQKTADILENGGLIIYPTDTVYAIGCLINQHNTLNKLADIKGVKLDKAPFSFFLKNFEELSKFVKPLDNPTFKLLKRCLPGPYTFILPSLKLPKPFEKRKAIGVRISNHPVLDALLDLLSVPLITTSLHDKDKIIDYTTDPALIFERWQDKIDLMLEDGFGGNIPSTVIDLCEGEPILIRPGKGDWI